MLIKVANGEDRLIVGKILLDNGYKVQIERKRKNGKTYEYYIRYGMSDEEFGKGDDESQI